MSPEGRVQLSRLDELTVVLSRRIPRNFYKLALDCLLLCKAQFLPGETL